MQKPKIKNLFSLFLLFGLSLLVLLFSLYLQNINEEINFLYLEASLAQPIIPSRSITLIFVGDIMLNRGVEWSVKKYGQGDFKFPFLEIANFLQEADILFGNLEGPISDKGVKVGSIYSFRNDPKAIDGLTYAGFDILSVANNHIFDYGREAMEDTFLRLKEAEIDYVGGGFSEAEAYSPIIKEAEGVRIAFFAYTNLGTEYWSARGNRSGIAWLDEKIPEDIKKAREQADIIIVSLHFGEEYWSFSTPEQKYFARLAIDSGADLVVGHHSHVIQEVENYKQGYIAYSLGNFIFDQGFSKETMEGFLLEVIIEKDRVKKVIPIKIKINEYFQPEIIKEADTNKPDENGSRSIGDD